MSIKSVKPALRTAWDESNDYNVVVHRHWTSKKSRSPRINKERRSKTLKHHPLYEMAKHHGDYIAAQTLVEDLLSDDALLRIMQQVGKNKPLLVAPSLTAEDPKNVIPFAFAHNISYQLGLQVDRNIFQKDSAHRTGRSGFYRLANEPEFEGNVIEGQTYVLVDDVTTLGGTMASLCNYIENNGGRVLCLTTLADNNMKAKIANGGHLGTPTDFSLKIQDKTLEELGEKHGPRLNKIWKEHTGHGIECLTDREAAFLRFHDRPADIQKAIMAEKDIGSP